MSYKPHGMLHRLTCMCRRARARRFAGGSCVLGVVLSVPAFAQTDSRTRAMDAPQIVTLAFDRPLTGVVRAYVPADLPAVESSSILPIALNAGAYRSLVEEMLRRSPTFRRQCQRLATPRLHAVVLKGEMLRGPRAVTQILTTAAGRLHAIVRLGPLDNDVELIAHEIEHVIEQLDGVDLRIKASLPNTGVHACDSQERTFETLRAIRIGLKVAEEFRQGSG
jgi:hypothetical protein